MTWNTAGDRKGWVTEGDDCSAQKKVTELLAEQVEAADVLLMNKMDLVEHDKLQIAATVAKGLNANAKMFEATYGKIPIEGLFGGNTITSTNKGSVENDNVANEHALSHSQQNDHNSEARHAPDCLDESNHHSHAHDHACSDPKCNVSTHHHDHNHHDHSSTSTDDLEISSFVFKASVPFNAGRLLDLLNKWPVPIKDELDIGQMQRAVSDGCNIGEQNSDVRSPFMGVLRSKGFCWLAPSKWSGPGDDTWRHDTAMYWSHAGKHFGITTAGKWWGSLSREQMKGFFTTNKKEFDRIIQEDFVSDEWGDRRQEIVFIGTNLGEDEINNALNKCLLTKAELEKYRQLLRNFEYSTLTSSGPSLFDIGGTDHIDANTR